VNYGSSVEKRFEGFIHTPKNPPDGPQLLIGFMCQYFIENNIKIMKTRICYLIPIIITLLGFSCEKNDLDCEGEPTQIPFEYLLAENSNETCVLKNIDDTEVQVNLIIQSQVDYEKYLECSDTLPSINFSEHTLLAGRLKAPNMDRVVKQTFSQDCTDRYLYYVEIGSGVATMPSDVYYFAIVPKIIDESTLRFEIKYVN